MTKRLLITLTVSALAAAGISVGLFVCLNLDKLLGLYPGSALGAHRLIDVAAWRTGTISWQTEYQTGDEFRAVRQWYLTHLDIAPALNMNGAVVDNCTWVTRTQLVWSIMHTISVMVCGHSKGTQVVVSERLSWWP